tara:strand:- start:243 stop:431 length:189 start_codon:yes stop_codon:yes gene_type:complete
MAQTDAQRKSSAPVADVNKLVKALFKRKLSGDLSTQRDIFDEEAGEDIANPDLAEYKRSTRG